MIELSLYDIETWKLISIPFVAGLVGWITNWVAIKLMFLPLEFVGFYPLRLGWQGIIPSKAEKMAKIVVEKGLQSLANMQEVFNQLDLEKLNRQFVIVLDKRLEEFVDEVALQEQPLYWENVPYLVKQRFYNRVRKQLPRIIAEITAEIGDHIEEYLDLEAMVSEQLVANKELLNRIFLEAGTAEFNFIIRSGFLFGFAFGVVQAVIWYFYPQWWILPLFGLLVGYATNDIALRIIFQPLNPIHLGPIAIQGIFLKRQKEVAAVLCRITTQEVLTINRMLLSILNGAKKETVIEMIHAKVSRALNRNSGIETVIGKQVAKAAIGYKAFKELTSKAELTAISYAKEELSGNGAFQEGQGEIIENLLRGRMESLSSAEFQDVLRPAFKEDEWILIVVGAVLGMAAGFAQLVLVFGHSLSNLLP